MGPSNVRVFHMANLVDYVQYPFADGDLVLLADASQVDQSIGYAAREAKKFGR